MVRELTHNKRKREKEHKENVSPFSMGDEAEPRV